MTEHVKRTGPAVEAHYQFLLWLVATADRFPKSQKVVFGDRILKLALDVLEFLVEARFTRNRKSHRIWVSQEETLPDWPTDQPDLVFCFTV
jgi:hypothetical protein